MKKKAAKKSKPKGKKLKGLDPKKDFDKPVKRKPRQGRLAGMEDNAIQDLEDAAIEHSDLRSEATASRVEFKERLRASEERVVGLMRKNNKTTYNHAGIRLKLREGHDSVSVQVKRHDRKDAKEEVGEHTPAEG